MSKRSRKFGKDSRQPPAKHKQETPEPKLPRGLTTDAFQNVLARLGHGTPNLMEGTEYPLTRLTQNYQLMNSLYRSHWIVRKIIDTIPEDMTRNWITISTQLPPDEIRKLDKVWRVRRVRQKILEGLKWGRLYGGAVGLIMIEGHDDILHQALDFDMIMPGAFKGLIILDRWSGVYPSAELVDDIDDPEFGLPESYQVTLDGGQTMLVHHSRIVRFTGREMPYLEKLAETYWGASEVEVVFDELKKRDNTSWNIAQLIFLANLRVMKSEDLGEMLAIGDQRMQTDIYNTLQAQNWLMSNMGLHLIGKNDEFQTHQYTFSGLNDIYESFMLDIAGASQIPVTKLFGRAPAGMNATGESDMQNYYEVVQQQQESVLGLVIDKLLPVMCMSEFGAIPDDLDYTFNPIRTPDDKEVADLAEKKTQSILEVYNAGLITQKVALKELKQLSDSTGMFSNITDADIEEAVNNTHQGELGFGGGLGYGESEITLGSEETNRASLSQSDSRGVTKFRRVLDRIRRRLRND
ncbi:DUF1073 domain-containing protein [Brevibacillus centrosporus]|uniref:phage portal protein n=1 Tax=Brevibacillus centrosporus TaxID=54910 RepID=UPI001175651D|nr:DUF1073 domain-containing protein [Brevibacillus centrosporus]MEC2131683.1 DUF1073 domain-containing protein [Brevibacillus centrosporus]GED34022.1 hypothetical protein BCE02nite_51630 [Brevibacillus centrosporus]